MGREARSPNGAVSRFEDEGGGGTATTVADARRGRRRIGGDRGDYELHEYVEPVGAHRRGAARAQRGRARAGDEVVGQDVARSGLESRHRLPGKGRTSRVSRPARIQPRRIRLHDLHRKLRPASERRRRSRRRRRPHRRRGALGKPQLRRTHSSAGSRKLSRVAAARRCVRARRTHGSRFDEGAARHGQRRQAGLSAGALAEQRRDRADDGAMHRQGDVRARIRRRL